MLNSFLVDRYVEITHEFVNRNGGHDINETDIAVAKAFTHFLHFFDETCALSTIYAPTSYLAIHSVTKIVEHLHDCNHFEIF